MYKVVRAQLDGVTEIETVGIMTPEDFEEYTYANFIGKDHGTYKHVFANKKEAKKALDLLAENGADTWLLGVNPESGLGETLVITLEPFEN